MTAVQEVTHISSSLGVTRETIKADTFRVDHLLPTMTVEEFGAAEMAGAMAREERSAEWVGRRAAC